MTDNVDVIFAEKQIALYRSLADADPRERANIVLHLIEEHPEGRLVLPATDGLRAMLDGIDLSRERITTDHGGAHQACWWNAERQAVDLRNADLRGVSLRGARLQGVLLEEADLTGADLAGSDLQSVDLSGASFADALFEGADLRKAVLRFVRGARSVLEDTKLKGADLWGAELQGADFSGADLQGAILEEVNLAGADLAGVDLREAILKRGNFKGANLRGADLRGAILGGTNLDEVVLQDAKMQELDLTDCSLIRAHTCGARLEKTRLDQEQIGGAIGEEVAGEFELARKGYLALERNFDELGHHDAASWAYRRRRRMEKHSGLVQAKLGWRERHYVDGARSALKFTGDQIVEYVCDYGESVWRVVGTLFVAFFIFLAAYGLSGTVLHEQQTPHGPAWLVSRDVTDLALFSMTAMTAGTLPTYLQPGNELAYLLVALQTTLSIFLTGLMGFVAGNRIRR